MKRSKKIEYKYKIFGIAIITLIAVIFGAYKNNFNLNTDNIRNDKQIGSIEEINEKKEYEKSSIDSDLKIYFFDVGQADSILVTNENESMLIDAGNEENGTEIVQYLQKLNISKIDYLIASHVHSDHIGGMDKVIDNMEIGKIYMPYTVHTTKQFEQLITSIENKKLNIIQANVGDIFEIGKAKCEIMCVDNSDVKELNLSSIVIKMVYGEQSYLFMGDAEIENENLRSWDKVNVLKVGHHGSDTSTGQKFIDQVKPEIAIISVGKDNTYNLPKDSVIERLKNIGAIVYRTDEDGTILLISDGKINKIEKINMKELD